MDFENSERRTAWKTTTAKLFVGILKIDGRHGRRGKIFPFPGVLVNTRNRRNQGKGKKEISLSCS